jgi:uncharacterized protein (TIGR02145 family)
MRSKFTNIAFMAIFGLALIFTSGCLEEKFPFLEKLPFLGGGSGNDTQGGCPNVAVSGNMIYCGGQNYKTVTIGKQVWMAQNLNYDVPGIYTDLCYANLAANCAKYGRLYDWATALALPAKCNNILSTDDKDCAIKTPYHQGICPTGWHIPSSEEWSVLMLFGEDRLKAKSGWNSQEEDPCCPEYEDCIPGCKKKKVMISGNGTDNYGFAALPGGQGGSNGSGFSHAGYFGFWWHTNEANANGFYAIYMAYYRGANELEGYYSKSDLLSIRCMKD